MTRAGYSRHRALTALAAVLAVTGLVQCAPADAASRPVAAPGVAIVTHNGGDTRGCTVGYTARDTAGDRLAVTAGHCADGVHQEVYLDNGVSIGTVIAWRPDQMSARDYGYTVIWLYDNVAQSPALDASTALDHADIGHTGDLVCMFGAKSGRTCGAIEHAEPGVLTTYSNIAQHGDSGAPVMRVTDGALIGIVVGGNGGHTDGSETVIEPISRINALVSAIPDLAGFGPIVANPR
ncbi:MAG: hypothetical protein AB7G47_20220 [Mycolicibacterium sp.]|uniref:hypothetical protein n=1 Tax=Mycolicibacterium sp. TaxID=2320850 RepID=UPI003D113BCE